MTGIILLLIIIYDQIYRRYERAQKSPEEFEADIQKYINLKDEVLSEGIGESIGFISIEYNGIKQVWILDLHCRMCSYQVPEFLFHTQMP